MTKKTMGSVTLQDAEQWVSFFTRMAEKEQVDTGQAYVNNCMHVLYPVEKSNIVLEETNPPPPVKEAVSVEMVSPIQETVEQAKSEYRESKKKDSTLPTPEKFAIKVENKTTKLIRSRTAKKKKTVSRRRGERSKRTSSPDQLSKRKRGRKESKKH